MRFECTEKKLRDAGYNLVEGDTVTVDDKLGEVWCSRGWGRDVDGNVPTGERIVTGAELQPAKSRHTVGGKEL